MSGLGLIAKSRCPALGRAPLLLLAGSLAACSAYPRPVEGLSPATWLDLPLRRWLAEDRAEPLAVAVCRLPECGPDMVVAVVAIHGPDADAAEAILNHPERLAGALRARSEDRSSAKPAPGTHATAAAAHPVRDGPLKGFSLSMSRADGSRAVFGTALGYRTGSDLRVVLAIGADPQVVEATARRAARANLPAEGNLE